jgi:formamidase
MGRKVSTTVGTLTVSNLSQPPALHPPPLLTLTVPFASKITPGETVKIECLDWTGGQIGNNDSADDVKNIDLTRVHYLSGPFEIEGAEPGDVLQVEIQDVQPFPERPWGFTAVFDKANGGGFLDEEFPQAAKG